MADVTKIWISEDKKELRVEWDNTRHQSIEIMEDGSRGFIEAMAKMVELLHDERCDGEI